MSKRKNNFKCPKCGCTSYTEYNDKLRNGAIGAAVGAFLLGPIGLLAAGLETGTDSTGRRCNNCGKKVPNQLSAQEKKARGAAGKSFGNIATNQFNNGYQQAMSRYSDDD